MADFELSKANLYTLNQEFEELLSDLSGFFVSKLMWFLLPEQQGVVLKFDTQDAVSANAVSCKALRCSVKVSDEWQDDKSVLPSHGKLISATPWIVK